MHFPDLKACCDWSEFSTTLDSADVCGAERGDDQTPTNVCVGEATGPKTLLLFKCNKLPKIFVPPSF